MPSTCIIFGEPPWMTPNGLFTIISPCVIVTFLSIMQALFPVIPVLFSGMLPAAAQGVTVVLQVVSPEGQTIVTRVYTMVIYRPSNPKDIVSLVEDACGESFLLVLK